MKELILNDNKKNNNKLSKKSIPFKTSGVVDKLRNEEE